jgi:hypothetical protein
MNDAPRRPKAQTSLQYFGIGILLNLSISRGLMPTLFVGQSSWKECSRCTDHIATDTVSSSKASELIQSHWRPEAIAKKVFCNPSTLYRWENRVQMYGAIDRPAHLRLPTGQPRRIHSAAVDSLLEYQSKTLGYIRMRWRYS